MSLTITAPTHYPITYKPVYTVDTSLTESSSYNNLRIRASLIIDGEVKAILEQPKGLTEFDFRKILDSYVSLWKKDRDTGAIALGQTNTSWDQNVWVNAQGFISFNSTGIGYVTASAADAAEGWIRTPAQALSAGDVIAIHIANTATWGYSGGNYPDILITNSTTVGGGTTYDEISGADLSAAANNTIFLTVQEDIANAYIWMGGIQNTNMQISMYCLVRIMTKENAIANGRPCVHYKVEFQTYYEDANGTTQTDAGEYKGMPVLMYAPVKSVSDATFATYILSESSTTQNLCTKSVQKDSATQLITYNVDYLDHKIMGLMKGAYDSRLKFSIDGAAYTQLEGPTFYHMGFFIINLYASYTSLTGLASYLRFYAYNDVHGQVSAVYRINFGSKCYPNPLILHFIGKLGIETVVLNGRLKKKYEISRDTFKNDRGVDFPIAEAYKLNNYNIETNDLPEDYFDILSELIASKEVVMNWDDSSSYTYDGILPVTIKTNNIVSFDNGDMINNDIDIIFWPYDE